MLQRPPGRWIPTCYNYGLQSSSIDLYFQGQFHKCSDRLMRTEEECQ